MKIGRSIPILLAGLITSACCQERRINLNEQFLQTKPLYHKQTVEDILSHSEDEELVRVSGEIVRKIKGKVYLFRGETGDIKVVIEDAFLSDQPVRLGSPVILKGEIDNPPKTPPRIEVEDIHYIF